jgi:hypothetical protein
MLLVSAKSSQLLLAGAIVINATNISNDYEERLRKRNYATPMEKRQWEH